MSDQSLFIYFGMVNKTNLIEQFKRHNQYSPDIDNPETYNEKVLRRKLTRDERLPSMSDKLVAKNYVDRTFDGVDTIPTLSIGMNQKPDRFPFIMKPTNSSGWNRIVRKEKEYKKSRIFLSNISHIPYGQKKGEWWYAEIPFQVFCEPLYEIDFELRCFAFHGRTEFFYIRQQRKNTWFTRDGEFLPIRCDKWKHGSGKLPDLGDSIKQADKMSKGFDHIRVDFLFTANSRRFFNEFTFAHRSGHCRWSDVNFDKTMGGYW